MANEKLHICDNPLVQHKVSLLRDKNTGAKVFRELVSEISMLMCYEATRDLPLKKVQIQTPIAIAESNVISGRKLAFVPILRAGLGMTEGVMALVPAAKIGHIGIFRGKGGSDKTVANEYYCKLPFDINERDVIVTDIMLATGTSAVHAIRKIKEAGVRACVSIKPGTPADVLLPLLPELDMVLIMTVEPGFGGQGYIDACTDKIRTIRKAIDENGYKCELEIDGGAKLTNTPDIVAAGANVIVAGSAVFGGDIEANVKGFKKIFDEYENNYFAF